MVCGREKEKGGRRFSQEYAPTRMEEGGGRKGREGKEGRNAAMSTAALHYLHTTRLGITVRRTLYSVRMYESAICWTKGELS